MVESNQVPAGEPAGPDTGLRVLEVRRDGESLYVELSSDDREDLVNHGRSFALDHIQKSSEYSGWSRAGVEKVSSPVAYDPENEKNDPYGQHPDTTTKWHYRQTMRLTRSPI